jgi:hypothetical protein
MIRPQHIDKRNLNRCIVKARVDTVLIAGHNDVLDCFGWLSDPIHYIIKILFAVNQSIHPSIGRSINQIGRSVGRVLVGLDVFICLLFFIC